MNVIDTKFFLLRNYWWLLGLVFVAFIAYITITGKPLHFAVPVLGTLLSLFYFVQKQKLEELKVFRDIFKECNSRYDKMNEQLAIIAASKEADLAAVEEQLLVDYFNLCAEEYLYYLRGVIDPEVWRAWLNGMRTNLNSPRVAQFWKKESASDSYYGLTI